MRKLLVTVALSLLAPSFARADDDAWIIGTEIGYQGGVGLGIAADLEPVVAIPHHFAWGLQLYEKNHYLDIDGSGSVGAILLGTFLGGLPHAGKTVPTSSPAVHMVASRLLNVQYQWALWEALPGLYLGPAFEAGVGMRGLADGPTAADNLWGSTNLAGGLYLNAGAGVGATYRLSEWFLLNASIDAGPHTTNNLSDFFGGLQLSSEVEAMITLLPNIFWLKLELQQENYVMLGSGWERPHEPSSQSTLTGRVSIVNNVIGWALGLLCD